MNPGRYLNQMVFGLSAGVIAPDLQEEPIVASTAHWSVENEIRFPWVRSIRLAFERVVYVTHDLEEEITDPSPSSEEQRQKLYLCELLGETEEAAGAAGYGDLAHALSSLALNVRSWVGEDGARGSGRGFGADCRRACDLRRRGTVMRGDVRMKRYELAYSNPHGEHLRENNSGDWVRYEDAVALAEENERLRNEIRTSAEPREWEACRGGGRHCSDGYNHIPHASLRVCLRCDAILRPAPEVSH